MTVEHVQKEVLLIEKSKGDPEAAHSYEDRLYNIVLKIIAIGAPNAKELAKAALETNKINFPRWCA